jgi:hypothetical protein
MSERSFLLEKNHTVRPLTAEELKLVSGGHGTLGIGFGGLGPGTPVTHPTVSQSNTSCVAGYNPDGSASFNVDDLDSSQSNDTDYLP